MHEFFFVHNVARIQLTITNIHKKARDNNKQQPLNKFNHVIAVSR